MNKLKQRFAELRKNTPKHVQWLLLGAAFIVVLILLTLMATSGDNDKHEIQADESVPLELAINPETLNWTDTEVGQSKKQIVKISANAPVRVTDVKLEKDINGLSVKEGCVNAGEINQRLACKITIEYVPTSAMNATSVPILIKWRGAQQPETMEKPYKYNIILGAKAPNIEPVVAPKIEPEPVVEPEPIIEDEFIEEFEEPETEEYIEDSAEVEPVVDLIAPVNTFVATETVSEPEYQRPPEQCSDFAFPGYNQSGQQIGWVKPKGGAYYFHPFSDKNCEKATGIYNPDNGIITDIDDSSKKIGTDAEHIGYTVITGGVLPELTSRTTKQESEPSEARSVSGMARLGASDFSSEGFIGLQDAKVKDKEFYLGSGIAGAVKSTRQYDRQFILRQYKPIPATIVSDVRADPDALKNNKLPVRATVDRNVYSDDGRNVIIPTGTLLLGYVSGDLPGPYTSVGRMDIKWYQFVLPNGVEFNFKGNEPFSGDAQGRSGIPGHGSTDYIEQFFMPMLTAIVPAAVNMIAPVTDAFVNQIDLDNNTVVQSGTVRSSELAKNEIITAWNQVAQKLLVDMMDNTVPPFTIAAGTRITVYSPVDLIASCGEPDYGNPAKCSFGYGNEARNSDWTHATDRRQDGSWEGQVRSFAIHQCCNDDGSVNPDGTGCEAYDYRTLVFYCQSSQYKAINMARQDAIYQNQQQQFANQGYEVSNTGTGLTGIQGNKTYNEQVLGLTYNEETGAIENPYAKPVSEEAYVEEDLSGGVITCEGGVMPDTNGCCPGETYTDMGERGFNCCPAGGGDCFPPIVQ